MRTKQHYFSLALALVQQLPQERPTNSQDIKNAQLLCSRVKRLDSYNVWYANEESVAIERQERSMQYKVMNLLAEYCIHHVRFNGDPRGYPVHLIDLPHPQHWRWRDFGANHIVPFTEDLKDELKRQARA